MSQENVKVVRKVHDAINRRDRQTRGFSTRDGLGSELECASPGALEGHDRVGKLRAMMTTAVEDVRRPERGTTLLAWSPAESVA